MVRFTHLTLSQLRYESEYQTAVERVKAEQFRLANQLERRLNIAFSAQKKIGKKQHLKLE